MKPYGSWPPGEAERRKLARAVFAYELQAIRSRALRHAEWLLDGNLPKKPDDGEAALAQWARTLDPETRRLVLKVAEEAVVDVLWALLVTLDGAVGGARVPDAETRYQLHLALKPRQSEGTEEAIMINSPYDEDLHDELIGVVLFGKEPS